MTVKFSQLDTLAATSITDNTILPVVDTTGTFTNKKIVAGSLKTYLSNIATTANLFINSTMTPNVGGIYDLGTTTYKFGNLYLGGNTIQFGPSTVITAGPGVAGMTISGNLVAPYFTGTLLTAAQPNITSVGTQTQLTLAGNIILNSGVRIVLGTDPGTAGQYLRSAGGGSSPTWANVTGLVAGFASNISGGAAGSVPYQIGTNTTAFLGIGTAGYMLTSTGSAPAWTNPASIIVNTANISAKLTGGAAGSIPYQTAANATAMLASPNSMDGDYSVLTQTLSGAAPVWRELKNIYVINGDSQAIEANISSNKVNITIGLKSNPNIGYNGIATTITMPHDNSANSAIATTAYVNGNIARNSQGAKIVSSDAPSGGVDGDVWYRI